NNVTVDDFARLVRAFAVAGSKAQDVVKNIKQTFGDHKHASIRINEVKFVAADPATGEISVAAQIAAQTLGPEFKQWLNDPQELLQRELSEVDANTKVNLQQLLAGLANQASQDQAETPLLMKAAEHMAIRFALDRFQKGEVKVNAVHQMLEHMGRQMDTLRQILKIQEDKMSKAGILVESHADILDRMFWAEVPEAGKKSVLLSHEAPCVPPRNVRQFIEVLLDRGDKETAASILRNYFGCLEARDADPRRKTATGLGQLADLFAEV